MHISYACDLYYLNLDFSYQSQQEKQKKGIVTLVFFNERLRVIGKIQSRRQSYKRLCFFLHHFGMTWSIRTLALYP